MTTHPTTTQAHGGKHADQHANHASTREANAADDHAAIYDEFRKLVNMTPHQLEKWLATDESREVGQKNGDSESVGHQSGRRIIELLGAKKGELSESDYAHMRKVSGYVTRHMAQRPQGDIEHTPWRYSLMNWGHDPLK